MLQLFQSIIGDDFLTYTYDPSKGTSVSQEVTEKLIKYEHEQWEENFEQHSTAPLTPTSILTPPNSDERTGPAPSLSIQKQKVFNEIETPVSVPKQNENTNPTTFKSSKSFRCAKVLQYSATPLKQALSDTSSHTRWQLASLCDQLPGPGNNVQQSQLFKINGQFANTDPFLLTQRPSKLTVQNAMKILHGQQPRPIGIGIPGYGNFDSQGLGTLKKFDFISQIKLRVNKEAEWLKNLHLDSSECEAIKRALWHTNSGKPILRLNGKCIDPLNYSDLVEERYLDNFTIDICIGMYMRESERHGKLCNSVYFPSEFFCWMTSKNKIFKLNKLSSRIIPQFTQILIPIHFENAEHWGLVYINLSSKQIMFDDGMKFSLPAAKLSKVKEGLDLLLELRPKDENLQSKFWSNTDVSTFGMPRQPLDGGVGSGSCGLGVILAARDFIHKGVAAVNSMTWNYSEMVHHRAETLKNIVLDWTL